MANVFDVVKYILEQKNEVTAMKLQKLVYYAQAWTLVWNEKKLFEEEIEAWANGPVTVSLYAQHKGIFQVDSSTFNDGSSQNLTDKERENIDKVLSFYGEKNAQWLSDLTHMEEPWKNARSRGCAADGEICKEVITLADMHEYYSGL